MSGRAPLKATENMPKTAEEETAGKQPAKPMENPYGPDYPKGTVAGR